MSDRPTSDPGEIAGEYAAVTRKMVNDAAQVAIDAAKKINTHADNPAAPPYTAGDAIRSMTNMANIAITSGAALARIPLHIQPGRGPMLIADQVAGVVARGMAEAAAVAGDAAEKMDAGTFRNQWVDSAITLTGIATLRAAEVAETIAAGPGVQSDHLMRSDPYKFDAPNKTDDLFLKIEKLARPGIAENIAHLVSFEPAVLKGGQTREFALTVDASGLPSGIFQGTVKAYKKGAERAVRTIDVTVSL